VRRWVSWNSDVCRTTVDHIHHRDLYSAARPSRTSLITVWCDTEYLACAEPLRRAGLSAAGETLVLFLKWTDIWTFVCMCIVLDPHVVVIVYFFCNFWCLSHYLTFPQGVLIVPYLCHCLNVTFCKSNAFTKSISGENRNIIIAVLFWIPKFCVIVQMYGAWLQKHTVINFIIVNKQLMP